MSRPAPLQDWAPCPFCYSRHLRIICAPVTLQGWTVVCGGCGALGPRSDSAEQAIARWNQRPDLFGQ